MPLLPRVFNTIPRARVEIRRVPVEIEVGAPGGYYQGAALDGSRPGAYYINLRDTHERPSLGLPTLSYHEAVPGHHFQISIAREAGELPLYRRTQGFSAFNEGWALYAERVADELGVYADDPFGRIGYLQSYLFRAVRLVVDSGLHHQRWSREQAVRYMMDNAAEPEGSARPRDRALLRLARPGLRLQGRPDRDRQSARRGRADDGRPLRHQGLPRSPAARRIDAADRAGTPRARVDPGLTV